MKIEIWHIMNINEKTEGKIYMKILEEKANQYLSSFVSHMQLRGIL